MIRTLRRTVIPGGCQTLGDLNGGGAASELRGCPSVSVLAGRGAEARSGLGWGSSQEGRSLWPLGGERRKLSRQELTNGESALICNQESANSRALR